MVHRLQGKGLEGKIESRKVWGRVNTRERTMSLERAHLKGRFLFGWLFFLVRIVSPAPKTVPGA